MTSVHERCSDSILVQHRSSQRPSNDCSSVSCPDNRAIAVATTPVLETVTSQPSLDEVNKPTQVSYNEVIDQRINELANEADKQLVEDNPTEAISQLTKAIALNKSNAHLYQSRARAYLYCGEFQSAILNLRKALQLHNTPELSSQLCAVYFVYSQCLYDLGCYQEALEVLHVSSLLQRPSLPFKLRKVMCLSALGDYDSCIEVVSASISEHGPLSDLLIIRARINYMFGNLSQCYYDITNVLCNHGDNIEAEKLRQQLEEQASITRGQALDYYLEGKTSESLKKISTAIDTDPASGDYHVFRGVLLRLMADYSNAIEELLLAMDKCHHDNTNTTYQNATRQLLLTRNDFAVYCYKQGRYSEAITLLNEAIVDHQDEQGLYINRGDCFYKLKKLHYALSDYQQASEVATTTTGVDDVVSTRIAHVAYDLAKTSFNTNNMNKAIQWLSLAIKHCPQIAAFYTARARAHHTLKDIRTAQADMITALQLGETEQNCFSILARLFPGQTAATLIPPTTEQPPVKECDTTVPRATSKRVVVNKPVTSPQEVLNKPLPPIGQSDKERLFHHQISQAKKQVNKQVLDVLTVSPSFPPPSPVIPTSPSKLH